MDPDLRRIDSEASDDPGGDEEMVRHPQPAAGVLIAESPPRTRARDQKAWVVFLGKKPGIYSDLYSPPLCTKAVCVLT
jgi:hypothetical protein